MEESRRVALRRAEAATRRPLVRRDLRAAQAELRIPEDEVDEGDLDGVRRTVQRVVAYLVDGEWAEVERISGGRRLSAADLADAVAEYGRTLVPLPEEGMRAVDVLPIDPAAWSRPDRRELAVHVPLWTREEGPSDLSLALTLVEAQDGTFDVEVDNVEVL